MGDSFPRASGTSNKRLFDRPALVEHSFPRASGTSNQNWLRVEHDVAKPTLKLKALLDLDCDTFVAEVRKVRGRKRPLSSAALANLRDEHVRSIAPLRALATEALRLEHQLSDLVNAAYHLTPAEIALLWQTAPPRIPVGGPSDGK